MDNNQKKARTVAATRLEAIRVGKELSTYDMLHSIADTCEENPDMTYGEAVTAWAKANPLRGNGGGGTKDDPERNFINTHFPTLEQGGTVTNIRKNKTTGIYSVTCELAIGTKQTFTCEFTEDKVSWGIQTFEIGNQPWNPNVATDSNEDNDAEIVDEEHEMETIESL